MLCQTRSWRLTWRFAFIRLLCGTRRSGRPELACARSVLGVLGHDLPKMPLAENQHVVQALTAQRTREPLRECVRSWRPACTASGWTSPGVVSGVRLAAQAADRYCGLLGRWIGYL